MQRAAGQFAGNDGHFGNRNAAKIINHHRQTAGFRQGSQQFIHHQVHHLRTVLGVDDRGAWFAVNAHTQLRVARMMTRGGVGFLRQMTAGKRNAQTEGVIGRVLRFTQDGGEVVAAFGKIARDFMHQDGSRNAARVFVIRQGDVIADNQHFNVVTKATGFLGGKTEIKTVTGVIFHDQQTARLTGYRLNGGQYRIYARGSEHVSTDCGG